MHERKASQRLGAARLVAACGLLLIALAAFAEAQTSTGANTESGRLVGTVHDGVHTWLGVPYAAPPVGDLRWRPPQPVQRSNAPLQANHLGASCMQKLSRSRPPWTEEFMVQNEAAEDCLYLNVWVPATGGKHAVLVFLHGGSFTEGSGGIASYNGAALARRGLVVVTVNYRLGVFGFLANTALTKESPSGSAGDWGLLDQVAALRWVQHNIAALGGDPNRVAVAGQSAGAASVGHLLASPLSKGLFQRAIIDSNSGIWPASSITSLAEALPAEDRWSSAHGGTLQALRAIPADTLQNVTDLPTEAHRPIVDGLFLTEQPGTDLRQPTGVDVPVIIGWNADETSSSPTYGKISLAEFRADAEKHYGAQAARFLQLYPAGSDAEANRSQIAAARDRNFAVGLLWAHAWAGARRSPVYFYYFSRAPHWNAHPEFRAHHTAEVPYFFSDLALVHRDYDSTDQAVSHTASQAWLNFADTGQPGGGWTPVTGLNGPVFELGDTSAMHPVLTDEKLAFWRSVLPGTATASTAATAH